VLTDVRCVGEGQDVATLIFKPTSDITRLADAADRPQERRL